MTHRERLALGRRLDRACRRTLVATITESSLDSIKARRAQIVAELKSLRRMRASVVRLTRRVHDLGIHSAVSRYRQILRRSIEAGHQLIRVLGRPQAITQIAFLERRRGQLRHHRHAVAMHDLLARSC